MRTQDVRDMLTGHQKPEVCVASQKLAIPNHVSQLKCIDAVGCRLNAIAKRTLFWMIGNPSPWLACRLQTSSTLRLKGACTMASSPTRGLVPMLPRSVPTCWRGGQCMCTIARLCSRPPATSPRSSLRRTWRSSRWPLQIPSILVELTRQRGTSRESSWL